MLPDAECEQPLQKTVSGFVLPAFLSKNAASFSFSLPHSLPRFTKGSFTARNVRVLAADRLWLTEGDALIGSADLLVGEAIARART